MTMTKSKSGDATNRMNSLVMLDYSNRMIARATGANIHKVKNIMQGVIGANLRGDYKARDEKMKRISEILHA